MQMKKKSICENKNDKFAIDTTCGVVISDEVIWQGEKEAELELELWIKFSYEVRFVFISCTHILYLKSKKTNN